MPENLSYDEAIKLVARETARLVHEQGLPIEAVADAVVRSVERVRKEYEPVNPVTAPSQRELCGLCGKPFVDGRPHINCADTVGEEASIWRAGEDRERRVYASGSSGGSLCTVCGGPVDLIGAAECRDCVSITNAPKAADETAG